MYFFVGCVVIGIIAEFIKLSHYSGNNILTMAYLLATIVLIILFVSLYIRRLHDFGKSGYWTFLLFVPLVNLIMFIYLIFKAGDKKKNVYGKQPGSFSF